MNRHQKSTVGIEIASSLLRAAVRYFLKAQSQNKFHLAPNPGD